MCVNCAVSQIVSHRKLPVMTSMTAQINSKAGFVSIIIIYRGRYVAKRQGVFRNTIKNGAQLMSLNFDTVSISLRPLNTGVKN